MTDYTEYFKKAKRSLRIARYIVIVFLAVFVVFSMTFYNEEITFDNFRYLMKYVEISPPSISDGQNNIRFSALSDAEFAMLGDKLAVINPDNISSYDINGRKILDEDVDYKNPISVSNGKYVLIYDLDGYSLSVYNSFSKVCEKTLPTQIEYVYLSADGGFAVITREKSYAGGVVCYNSKYSKVFTFMTRTASITDVCFDGQRGLLACATTDVRDGDFYSEIFTFDISNDEEIKSKTEIFGELPLSMFCAGKNFAVMTDSAIHIIGYDGEILGNADFGYDTPASLYRFADCFAISCKSALAGTDSTVNVYGYDGKLLLSEHLSEETVDIDIANGAAYILSSSDVSIYSYDQEYIFTSQKPYVYENEGPEKARSVFSLEDGEYVLGFSSGAVRITPETIIDETEAEE